MEATAVKAAERKFRELDRNQDLSLDSTEYRDFKRLLKRIISPKSCARIFVRLSDTDGDELISLREWNVSLGLDEVAESRWKKLGFAAEFTTNRFFIRSDEVTDIFNNIFANNHRERSERKNKRNKQTNIQTNK